MVTPNCDRCGQLMIAGKCKKCDVERPKTPLERASELLEQRKTQRRKLAEGVRIAAGQWVDSLRKQIDAYEEASVCAVEEQAYAKMLDDPEFSRASIQKAEDAALSMVDLLDNMGRIREALSKLPEIGDLRPSGVHARAAAQIVQVPPQAPPQTPQLPPPPVVVASDPVRPAAPPPPPVVVEDEDDSDTADVSGRWHAIETRAQSMQVLVIGGYEMADKRRMIAKALRVPEDRVVWMKTEGDSKRGAGEAAENRLKRGLVAVAIICDGFCGHQLASRFRDIARAAGIPFATVGKCSRSRVEQGLTLAEESLQRRVA